MSQVAGGWAARSDPRSEGVGDDLCWKEVISLLRGDGYLENSLGLDLGRGYKKTVNGKKQSMENTSQ